MTVDSADQSEAGFLQSLQVDPRRDSGATILLAPPGQPVAKFTSAVTKEQIVAELGNENAEVGLNAIEVYVHRLRKKLEPCGVVVRTIRGLGYLLEKQQPGMQGAEK